MTQEGPFDSPTRALTPSPSATAQGFEIEVVDGPDAPKRWAAQGAKCSIGVHPSNDLVLSDQTISRFHCELVAEPLGLRVRDMGSRNRTILDGVPIVEAFARTGSTLVLGATTLRVVFQEWDEELFLSRSTEFGALVGRSVAIRHLFGLLEKAAASDATVLLSGETGTGKEEAALGIHAHGRRASGPFIIVDCGAIPAPLLESELFGHEKGAFTGANDRRVGAFEEANGGTIFLDEIGELPLELQPKILRVIERRHIRRVGSNRHLPIDVRVIAATNRDLRASVNEDAFRPDLYFRLAVFKVELPALREHPGDIPLIARKLLDGLGVPASELRDLTTDSFMEALQRSSWPGNVRELRNYLERCLVLGKRASLSGSVAAPPQGLGFEIDFSLPYSIAREQFTSAFEKAYAEGILARHAGNIPQAAKSAGISRVHLWRLAKKAGEPAGI